MTTLSPPGSPTAYRGYNERPAQDRPRAVSSMSTASASSRRSKESKKLELTETSQEKRRLNNKADPSRALAEATPAEVALSESTLDDLRRISVKDDDGNAITEPDRSNPTRYRFERPLDTIRSFNAAAEGTSHRRSSYNRAPSQHGSEIGGNRRGSYYGNGPSPMSPPRQRPGQGGYYRNSSYGFQHHQGSVIEDPHEGQYYGHPQQRMRQPLQPSHNNSYHNGPNGYHNGGYQPEMNNSAHTHQQSYETMTSGSDENSKSTNPSSLNSSFDQLHQLRKPDAYGYQQPQPPQPNPYADEMNFSPVHPQKLDSYGRTGGGYPMSNGQPQYGGPVQQGVPPPPPKEMPAYRPNNPRMPIKLDAGPNAGMPMTRVDSGNGGKRQSWLKRKLSRKV